MRFSTRTVRALAVLAALAASVCAADAMTVRPLAVDLQTSGRGMNQIISVQNTSDAAIPVELSVEGLTIDSQGPHPSGKDPGDLVVFPPQALIQPGQTQTFRIQYVGDTSLTLSKHYYIKVAQLPVTLPQGQSGIQLLYNFQVLASVGPEGAKPAMHVLSAAIAKDHDGKPAPLITIANDSATYGYVSRGELHVAETDASGHEIFSQNYSSAELQQKLGMGLVDGGQQRQFMLPVVLPSADGTVSAHFTLKN